MKEQKLVKGVPLEIKKLLLLVSGCTIVFSGAARAADSESDEQSATKRDAAAPKANPANQTYGKVAPGPVSGVMSDAQEAKLIKSSPELMAQLNSGYSLLQKGQYDQAIKTFCDGVRSKRESATARRYLAYALLRSGQPAQAVDQILQVSKIARPSAYDMYLLGEGYLASGQYEQARDSFRDALGINENLPGARGGLIKCMLFMQEFDDALKMCAEQLQKAKDKETQKYYQELYAHAAQLKSEGSPFYNKIVGPEEAGITRGG